MLCLKKVYTDELLQIAILLSLLRVDRNSNLGYDYDVPAIGVGIDDIHGWDQSHSLIRREIQVHPKNLDSILLNYEQQLFDDLNSLGRYNRINSLQDVTAYLLNIDGTAVDETNDSTTMNSVLFNRTDEETSSQNAAHTSSNNISSVLIKDEPEEGEDCSLDSGFLNFNTTENLHFKSETEFNTSVCLDEGVSFKDESSQGDELTLEDMNLIEVLWKQDVDMGFTMSTYQDLGKPEECPAKVVLKHDTGTGSSANQALDEKSEELNPWEGLSYTIDLETGEYVLKNNLSVTELSVDEPPSSLLRETDYSLEDAFQLVSLNEENFQLSDPANISGEVASAGDIANAEEVSGRSSETSASFSLVSLDEDSFELPDSENISADLADVVTDSPDVSALDPDQQLDLLTDMIQTPQFHARPFQGRMPYMRTMSMEQRWQDLANLLSLPDPNHPYHHFHHPAGPFPTSSGNSHSTYSGDSSRNVLLHNATLAPPVGDLNSSSSYPNLGGASNIGSAVATSMNLTNSSEPMGSEHGGVSFKIENPHDMMYYQNGTSEMNHTADGFLSSILNDEDLQLMDMAMNEGMYTMRMLEGAGNTAGGSIGSSNGGALSQGAIERGTDSDSAVSSMGSERVPSLSSDTEWMETNSDSGHTPADHYTDYHGKFRWYEYGSYTGRQHSMEGTAASGQHRMPSVAQKKHHMYGKRYFQEQGIGTNGNSEVLQGAGTPSSASANKFEFPSSSESGGNTYASSALDTTLTKSHPEMKYSCSVEFSRQHLQTGLRPPVEHVAHNHTYHLPPEHTGTLPRPVARDKQKGRRSEDEHMTRDEKRARTLNIPMAVSDIINLPMDEFNERLSKYDLSESQLSLIRDIRRRGKNKVAAQNCRKRKLDQIMSLADEVKQMRDRKHRLMREREFLLSERQRIKNKFTQLYRHIFQALRDADGNPYSPYEWSLQQSADGSVLLVPRSSAASMLDSTETRPKHKDPDPRTQSRKP